MMMKRRYPNVSNFKNSIKKLNAKFSLFISVDESIDYTKIDYEARRVKARRAHEEIISGRYRQPNLAPSKIHNKHTFSKNCY